MNPKEDSKPPDSNSEDTAPGLLDRFKQLLEEFAESKMAGDEPAAMTKALEAFSLASEETARNPTPELLMMEEADDRECHGDWAAAERARREVLRLSETEGNLGIIAKAHHDLSQFFQLRGRLDEAWTSALDATAAARRFELDMALAMMLENEAWCALIRGQADRALQAVEEGLNQLEATPMTRTSHARLRVLEARCLAARQDWSAAEVVLAKAREWMDADGLSSVCPGPIATKAACWEVEAALCTGRNDPEGAVEAWRKAVEMRRSRTGFAHLRGPYTLMGLGRALEGLSVALEKMGCLDEAQSSRDEAARLRRLVNDGCAAPEDDS
jgi:tetratricopeptide (TPR) repeat protein